MNVIVCVKQVPGTTSVEVDPETGVLKRDAVEAKLNPYDLFAVEEALKLAAAAGGGCVTALSMGPPQARAALLETVYMGADRAVLACDRRFAGSDVLATAYTLSRAALSIGFDIILCGKQTTDGDTAQVGAEIAEFLGIPHVTNVLTIKCGLPPEAFGIDRRDKPETQTLSGGRIDPHMAPGGRTDPQNTSGDQGLVVTAAQENRIVTYFVPLPCLLCVDGGVNTPRLPSYKRKRGIADDPVRVLTLSDLDDTDERNYGLRGSPTQVERIYTPEADTSRETITGDSDQLADRLAAILSERKFI